MAEGGFVRTREGECSLEPERAYRQTAIRIIDSNHSLSHTTFLCSNNVWPPSRIRSTAYYEFILYILVYTRYYGKSSSLVRSGGGGGGESASLLQLPDRADDLFRRLGSFAPSRRVH